MEAVDRQLAGTRRKTPYWRYRELYLMLIPVIAYYVVFHYVPMYGAQIAFKDYKFNLGIIRSPWVGFEHFQYLFSLRSFKEIFRNTILISTYKLIFGFPAPIILAILLNELRIIPYKKAVQTVSYLPHFLSWVILAAIFTQLLSPSTGALNILLTKLGFEPIFFLGDKSWFRSVLVFTSVWKGVGWGSIIYLASIAGINPEIYEAAIVDGAGRMRRIWHVTLPGLTPVITILLIFAIGRLTLDDFDQIFNLYNPSVYSVGDVISTYTYRKGLVELQYSFSAAVGLFQNAISLVLIVIVNWVTKRFNEYGIW